MIALDQRTILDTNDVEDILREIPSDAEQVAEDVAIEVDYFRPLFSGLHGAAIGAFYGIGGQYYYVKDKFTPGQEARAARYRNGAFVAGEPARPARFDYDLDSTIAVARPPDNKDPLEPDANNLRVSNPKILDAIEDHIIHISGKAEVFIRRASKTYKVVPAKAKIQTSDTQPLRSRKVA